jgi:HK97 family phage major capsid protein
MTNAQAEAIAERIVREAAGGKETRAGSASSYAEFRSKVAQGRTAPSASPDWAFWRYATSQTTLFDAPDRPAWAPERYLFEPLEQRALSKATGPAGGFLVPSDFDEMITSARRARNVIGSVARVIVTSHGRPLPLPTATAHGAGSWVAENAAVSATDDTFSQVSVGAYKAATKTIVSEELVQDALEDEFDRYLAEELGQRLALLEETAFTQGDGTGKPLGIVTSGNGVATVAAATGSATGFTLADVRSVWAALPEAYKANAAWLMSPSAFASLANLTASGLLVLPSLHNEAPTLYSRPVYVSPELPAAAANARSVVVGDFQAGYAVRRMRGLGLHRQWEIHSDSGQIGYRLFERVDGRVVLADALRILVNSAT